MAVGKTAAGADQADDPSGKTAAEPARPLVATSLVALGIVYGDIGTSPLYAFRESLLGHALLTPSDVLGVLSLIFWALIIVISIKYLLLVMRADNRGEGGIIALVSLLGPRQAKRGTLRYGLISLGMFGAALLYGDGTITPAISVLSAIEGLEIATPAFGAYVVPITIVILVALFTLQHRGTAAIGAIFGPIMLIWFLTLAILGILGIARQPAVLAALNPFYAYAFFDLHVMLAFAVLGTVFLVVTGGEVLYADMGHFGPTAIRFAWFTLVLPSLVLNYFGQGALVLIDPEGVSQPFYELAPRWALYPLVALAATATVIASQAVISGVFSLTQQAVQLGLLPRMTILHTHSEERGQIYIPGINWLLMVATTGLVIGFRSSAGLASAYGVAISTDMVITTVLAFFVARRWGWNAWLAGLLAVPFLAIDLSFFGATLLKIPDGGWYPLALGGLIFALMLIWRRGCRLLVLQRQDYLQSLDDFLASLRDRPPLRVAGTAVFVTPGDTTVPPVLLHHLRHNQVLHETVVLLRVETEDIPRVPAAGRLEIACLERNLYRVVTSYGFMQTPNIPVALRLCEPLGLTIDLDTTTFYLGRETLIARQDFGLPLWQDRVFDFLSRNATRATAFYHLPPERVMEIGSQVEI